MEKESLIDLLNKIHDGNHSILELHEKFKRIATLLFNIYYLEIDDKSIEFTEVEFYYFNDADHPDPFVHLNILQKNTINELYVHKQPWGRGGIDITFGNEKYYGGILIRGIKENHNFYAGPSIVKQHISKISNNIDEDYKSLQKHLENQYSLKIYDKKIENKTYFSTRVGLNINKDEVYSKALYRFVREDYLFALKDYKFISYGNLKDRSKLKAIYDLAGYDRSNENATKLKLEEDLLLMQYIKRK